MTTNPHTSLNRRYIVMIGKAQQPANRKWVHPRAKIAIMRLDPGHMGRPKMMTMRERSGSVSGWLEDMDCSSISALISELKERAAKKAS